MGKCFSSEDRISNFSKPFNDFFYLCRELKYLIRISPGNISKLKYDKSIKIRKDSGVGYLSDGRIIVGGGTDSSGCLTSNIYLLDPVRSKVTVLPNLPVTCKEGNFFHYKESVFYIGGIKDSDEEDVLAQEQTVPLMKYYLSTGQWEVFNEEKSKKSFQDYFKNNPNKMIENSGAELSYTQILYPAMFMVGSKVYLINGQMMTSRGILETMDTVFSLDLEQEDFDFKIENFKSPLDVFRPTCGSYLRTGFMTGGLVHSSKRCSLNSYIIQFDEPDPVFTPVPGLKLNIDDIYPIIGSSSSFISVAFPNLAIYDRESETWSQYIIDHVSVLRTNSQKTTPFLMIEEVESRPLIKTKTKLAAPGKKIRLVSEDIPSRESLTMLEGSLNIELPPGLILEQNCEENKEDLASSDTFSVEKRISLPEPLKNELGLGENNLGKTGENFEYKNRPIADLIKNKSAKDDQADNQIFNKKGSIPVFSESDSIVSDVLFPVKDQGECSSESFEEGSESEISGRGMIPLGQKMAPIRQGIGRVSRDVSYSEQSISDSFAYEDYK